MSFPSSTGMEPPSGFPFKSSLVRFDRLPSSGGMPPVKSLPKSRRSVNSDRFASSSGITPVSSCLASVSHSSFDSSPSSGGIVPVSVIRRPSCCWLVPRSSHSRVTRPGVPRTVIPSHSLMALSALQLRRSLPRSVSFALSSVSQSATSPGLLAGLETAVPCSQRACAVAVCSSAVRKKTP